MIEIKRISTTYKENNNKDYKETYRELETNKKVSDIDAEVQNLGAKLTIYKGEELIDLENMSLKDYRKIASLFVKTLEKEIVEVRADSANVYKSSVSIIARI